VLNPLHGKNKTRRRYTELGTHLKDGSGTGNDLSVFSEEDNNSSKVGHL
jgi:hypothetical protein